MTIIALASLTVLAAGTVAGIGWYFSGQVIDVFHEDPQYPFQVVDVDEQTVTLTRDPATEADGVFGVEWDGGRAVVGDVKEAEGDTVTRELRSADDALKSGLAVRVDTWVYGDSDPKTALGIDYAEVDVPGPLGDMPAWHVPGESDAWVVAVHGRNASPAETLRAIPAVNGAGAHVLAVTHRNDEGAPASPDGFHHLGDSEWEDVEAAVEYAKSEGASSVVLAGWSMGGAVVMSTLRRMDDSDFVSGVILDSPTLDWSSTLDKQGDARGLPRLLTGAAKFFVEWRADIDLKALDQREYAADMTTPVLLFADTADETVDVSATLEFADAVPQDLMTLVTTEAGHTASWNADPDAYDHAVTTFLDQIA
ncbi:MAG: alpha/beta hydrolase [Stackebrandtia sp.]